VKSEEGYGQSFASDAPDSVTGAWSTGALNAEPISEQQAHAIGVDAYLYFYSPITMDLTRKQLTNVEPGKGFSGPTNTFANVPAYPNGGGSGRRAAQF
jgi:hypothetical protein